MNHLLEMYLLLSSLISYSVPTDTQRQFHNPVHTYLYLHTVLQDYKSLNIYLSMYTSAFLSGHLCTLDAATYNDLCFLLSVSLSSTHTHLHMHTQTGKPSSLQVVSTQGSQLERWGIVGGSGETSQSQVVQLGGNFSQM